MDDAIRTYGEHHQIEASKLISTDRAQMLKAITRTKLCLIGDFHTYGPCQRFFAHTLEAQEELHPNSSICILEFIAEEDEKTVGEFLDSKISLEDLLGKTGLQYKWPFPLAEYARVLEICRKRNISVFGMRTSEGSSLYQDDLYFSSRIQYLLSCHPAQRALVLVGEKHLSQNMDSMIVGVEHKVDHAVSVFVDRHLGSENLKLSETTVPRFFCNEQGSLFYANRHPEWKKWLSVMCWERWVEGESRLPNRGLALEEIDTSEIDAFLFEQAKEFLDLTLNHGQPRGDTLKNGQSAIENLPVEGLPVAELAKSAFTKAFLDSRTPKDIEIELLQYSFLKQLYG